MSNEESDLNLVQEHVDALMEHFDSVQVFCTRHDPMGEGGTVGLNKGAGNWHSRSGQVREWIVRQDEIIREDARKEDE